MPGGRTRATVAFEPYPFYAVRAEGSRIWDVDGNERIDFLNNYTSLVLGHRHPAVIEAVGNQLTRGNVFGCPSEREIELAERLCDRVPSFDQVILTTTGTEAVVAAIRTARAFTGKSAIAKVEGGFHGTYDHVNVSMSPDPAKRGPRSSPVPLLDSGGIPPRVLNEVHVFHWNDASSCARTLERNQDVAAVVIEPILGPGGMLPPKDGFLEEIREITRRSGVVLIFDEVFAHRISVGGAQEHFGVEADLVALSKSMGSGFPIGAVGGRRDLMSAFARTEREQRVFLSGTFHGNPLSASAAIATLDALTSDVCTSMNGLGDSLRSRLNERFEARSVAACATGAGSLFQIHVGMTRAPHDHREVSARRGDLVARLHLALLGHGVILAPTGLGCLSAATSEDDVEALVSAVDAVAASGALESATS